MADPTLMVSYDELLTEVRTYLGFGSSLSASEQAVCDRCIKQGLSEFYAAHSWTFLSPVASITVGALLTGNVTGLPVYTSSTDTSAVTLSASSAEQKWVGETFTFDTSSTGYTVQSVTSATVIVIEGDASGETSGDSYSIRVAAFDLPGNFGSMAVGSLFQRANSGYAPARVIDAQDIEALRRNVYSGIPKYAAIRHKTSDLSAMQKKEVIFYPTPDDTYTFTYQYDMLNDMLSSGEYPVGDSRHRNTVIEACVMHAEQQEDDTVGLHTSRYQGLLMRSMEIDSRNEPAFLGYNADNSDFPRDYPAATRNERILSHYYGTLDMPDLV